MSRHPRRTIDFRNNKRSKDEPSSPICRNCQGCHDKQKCPKTYKTLEICSNCNKGRHEIQHCSRPLRYVSKAGKDFFKPFVYGNDSMYEEHDDNKAPSSSAIQNVRFDPPPDHIQQVVVLETFQRFDSFGKVLTSYQRFEKVEIPRNSNEVIFVEIDD